MRATASWCRQHPLLTFYALTLALSWGYWGALLAAGMKVGPGSRASHFPGLPGPLISAFIVTAYIGGADGVRALLLRCVTLRINWRTLLLALSPLVAAMAVFSVQAAFGEPLPALSQFDSFPGLPAGAGVLQTFVLMFVINGLGEEAGWRGFAMEELLARTGAFRATMQVALLWLVWDAPLFWINTHMPALGSPLFLGWMAGLICGAFVLAHVYVATGRSVLAAALWHTLYNLAVASPASSTLVASVLTAIVMVWGVAIATVWLARRK